MNSWDLIIKHELEKSYFSNLLKRIEKERQTTTIFPKEEDVFKALSLTPIQDVKVVLLGQDPYHEPGQACGLAFSVPRGEKIPPSLRNIYKELNDDLQIDIPNHGDLTNLQKEGVLLLNTVLTVKEHHAMSHHNYGWQQFTDVLISELNKENHPIVFILLGNYAKSKKTLITNPIHHIIEGVHPSPLSASRGFFGSKIFSRTNQFLINDNLKPINWNIINYYTTLWSFF